MVKQQTITINGIQYDTHSGLRVASTIDDSATITHRSIKSASIHTAPKKAVTLQRKHVRSGQPTTLLSEMKTSTRSPHITRFAKSHPEQAIKKHTVKVQNQDIKPLHRNKKPVTAVQQPVSKQPLTPSNHVRKQQAIAAAVSKTDASKAVISRPVPSKKVTSKKKMFILGLASVLILSIVSAGVYASMPDLMIKVAAAQSGIQASYPTYRPPSYNLDGAVAYRTNEVVMNFVSKQQSQRYSLTQTKSSWNSEALLSNYVQAKSNNDYITYNDSGLTIYVYGTNAAWVNGGILHTITGRAELSNDQMRRIATSM